MVYVILDSGCLLVTHGSILDAIVFVGCDIAALVIQAIGGATASQAMENHHSPKPVRINLYATSIHAQ